jgi:hypothetical protein
LKICGVAGLVLLLVFAALGPARWQVRSGLGWQFDHIAGYFAFTLLFSLACRRPLVVGLILMASAMLLEALQALTPDRCCDMDAALYGACGALAGALFAALSFRAIRSPRWGWQGTMRVTEPYFPKLQSVYRLIVLKLTRDRHPLVSHGLKSLRAQL